MRLTCLRSVLRALAIVAISADTAGLLSACATRPVTPAPPAGGASAVPADAPYRLGAGDELSIKFFYTPELNEQQIIRPDGKIAMPLIGEVQAGGLSPSELHDKLVAAYVAKYLKPGNSDIQVTVRTLNSARVFVGGEVGQAGAVPLIGRMTVSRAIMLAQGFKSTAYTHQVLWIHATEDGHADVHQINVQSILQQGAEDPVLSSQDIVFVPRSPIARVNLFVEQYIRNVIPPSMTIQYTFTNGVRVY